MPLRLRALPRLDLALAVALACLALADVALRHFDRPLLAVVAAAPMTLPLAVRRTQPLVALVIVIAGLVLRILAGPSGADPVFVPIVLLSAVYSTGAYGSGRERVAGYAIALCVGATALQQDSDAQWSNTGDVAYYAMLFSFPWLAGAAMRRFRERTAATIVRAAEAERARASAVEEERIRIARELHDVVAHAISVIVLQARGGRRIMDADREQARQALDAIESAGEQALTEMGRLLGMLRSDGERVVLAPRPSMRHLEDLVSSVRAAGLPVDLSVAGEVIELPPGVDLSAYRIVQEALTNALKHAGPARAHVSIRYAQGALQLEITDDGRRLPDASGGHGLTGMRERVAVFGGRLESGRRPEGGYALRAMLPLESGR
jgi:signal transduction histidine kinase